MRVRALALVVLVLTAAAPAQAEDVDPLAVVKTLTTDTVRVVVSIDGPPTGTVLPLCEPQTDPEPNGTLVGTVTGGCFLPLGGCEMVIVIINPDHTPPKVSAGPDWRCIEDRIEDLVGRSDSRVLLPIHLEA